MKKLLIVFLPLLFIFFNGCSNNGTGTGSDPFGGGGIGGGGTGSVTWTISQRQGDNGGIMFTAKPSVAVTVTSVAISLPAQNFNDPVQGDGQTVYQPGQFYDISEYTGVASGQQWTFAFQGKVGSSTGTAYTANSNYTVP